MKLKTITQEITFNDVNASILFDLYTDAEKHAAATGAPAIITNRLGEPFNLYNGFCFGENIELKKNKLILQSWRTNNWPVEAEDSIVIIRFLENSGDTQVYLTHANIPEALADALGKGWDEFYWNKWKTYLSIGNKSISAQTNHNG